MQHEHCSRGQTDAPGALTDGVTQSIEQRLNDEAEFASMLQGQTSIAKIGEAMSICCSILWQTAMTILRCPLSAPLKEPTR